MRGLWAGRNRRLAAIAGIVTFALLGGTGASWAYWTSQTATAALSVTASTLTLSSTGAPGSYTLGNENVSAPGSSTLSSPPVLTSMTFTNTTTSGSTQAQTLNVVFSSASGGDPVLAAATTVAVWQQSGPCTSTPAANAATGTWSSGVTVSTPLAIGASVSYCILSTISTTRQSLATTNGSRSFTPQAAARLSIANFSYLTTSSASAPMQSRYIYPLAPITTSYWYAITRIGNTGCVDVWQANAGVGASLGSWVCKTPSYGDNAYNQQFKFMPRDANGFGALLSRLNQNLQIAAPASTASGGQLTTQTANSTDSTQLWQAQQVPSGGSNYIMFVNKYSGLCMDIPAATGGSAPATQTTCNGSSNQLFSLTQYDIASLPSFSCTTSGSSVSYSWTAGWNAPPLRIDAQNGSTWYTIATVTNSATSAAIDQTSSPLNGWSSGILSLGQSYNVRIVDVNSGAVIGTSSLTLYRVLIIGSLMARC